MNAVIKNKKYILFILALLGLAVSTELVYIYFKANFVANAGASFCKINEVIDCDAVAKTSYSVFLGVPLAVYGICFYSFLMFLSMFPFSKFKFFKNYKHPESYIFTLSSLAVISSVILGTISSLIIHKICLLCYILYGVNFAIFIFGKIGKPALTHFNDSFADLKKILSDESHLIVTMMFTLICISTLAAINVTKVFIPPVKNQTLSSSSFAGGENTYRPSGNVLGSKNAKLVINEYTDFQCPYCAISNSMMYRLVSEVKNVKVVHHDFPLNTKCNPLVKFSPHKNSCEAIYYARAAKKQGKYWDYITLLFENQQNLSETKLIELAKSIKLDIPQLKKDAYSPEIKKALEEDLEKARNLKINATPTYVIGIKKYEGLMPYPELKETVQRNL